MQLFLLRVSICKGGDPSMLWSPHSLGREASGVGVSVWGLKKGQEVHRKPRREPALDSSRGPSAQTRAWTPVLGWTARPLGLPGARALQPGLPGPGPAGRAAAGIELPGPSKSHPMWKTRPDAPPAERFYLLIWRVLTSVPHGTSQWGTSSLPSGMLSQHTLLFCEHPEEMLGSAQVAGSEGRVRGQTPGSMEGRWEEGAGEEPPTRLLHDT